MSSTSASGTASTGASDTDDTGQAAPGEAPAPPRGGRRGEYPLVLALIAAAAGGLLGATGQVWAHAVIKLAEPLAPVPVELSGSELSPMATGMGWASLAALAGVVATRGWARRTVGALIALFGAATAAGVVQGTRQSQLRELASSSGPDGVVSGLQTDTVWPWIALLSAAVLLVLGVATIVRGPAWPAMSSRYDRHRVPLRPHGDDPASLWKSLDSGADPTEEPPAASAGPVQGPA